MKQLAHACRNGLSVFECHCPIGKSHLMVDLDRFRAESFQMQSGLGAQSSTLGDSYAYNGDPGEVGQVSAVTSPELIELMRKYSGFVSGDAGPAPQKAADAPSSVPARCTPIFGESSLSDLRNGVLACWDSFRPAGF